MKQEQAKLNIVSALLSVAETAIFKAHVVLGPGTLRQRIAKLHQDTLALQSVVVQESAKYD